MRQPILMTLFTLLAVALLCGAPLRGGEYVAKTEVPRLAAPAAYTPRDNTLEIELSEYAGYAGLIVANGGLQPSENSVFFKKYGFKVKLSISEEESWSALNSGKMAASATTVDVLAVYGRQFQVQVPLQIGFSRGADGIVVRNEIKTINQLKGKVIATAQFTEAEFFIRYLAQEAGLEVAVLANKNAPPDAGKVNLVFSTDAFEAGDAFLEDIKSNANKLAGCVTWAPKTTEVAAQSGGKALVLKTNKNLLIVADILVVNKGFAQQNPKMIEGLVEGILTGNRMVRANAEPHIDVIGKAFGWEKDQTREELKKVHLSNLPENQAFFSGSIDAAGSYGGIYHSAVFAYGRQFIKDPVDGDKFLDLKPLDAAQKSGAFADEKITLAPIKSADAPIEGNPILTKDLRFLFEPNSSVLDMKNEKNMEYLADIKRLVQVSPGSIIHLVGHVDDALKGSFPPAILRKMSLKAVELSKARASEVKRILMEKYTIPADRLEAEGRGWDEPLGTEQEQNRRVEVRWFTLE